MQRRLVCWTLLSFALALTGCAEPSNNGPAGPSIDVVQIGLAEEPGTLDPHQLTYAVESVVLADLYLSLFEASPEGKVAPAAASAWSVSADGKQWRLTIRKDLKWSDGRPIDAYDFQYALRRYVTPSTASRQAFLLNPVVNAAAIIAGNKPPESLGVSIPADDPYQLIIDLHRPAPELVTTFAGSRAGVPLPRHIIEAHPKSWATPEHWVSNGAYTLSSWRPQEYLELSVNPHFPESVAIAKFRYIPAASPQAEYNRFRSGALHTTSTVPMADVPQATEQYTDALRASKSLRSQYLVFNTTQPPFDDIELRRALALVIDSKTITDKILPVGFAPTTSIVPPTVSNYTPAQFPHAQMAIPARKALAKQLLLDAGYNESNPLKIELRFIDAGLERKKATIAIMGLWREIGVVTQLQQSEMKVHYADVAARNYQVAFAAWSGSDTPQSFLYEYSVDDPTSNLSGYRGAEFRRVWQQALNEPDSAKRHALFNKAEAILLADYIVVPLFNPLNYHLVSPSISGWQDNPLDSHQIRYLSWGRTN